MVTRNFLGGVECDDFILLRGGFEMMILWIYYNTFILTFIQKTIIIHSYVLCNYKYVHRKLKIFLNFPNYISERVDAFTTIW